ncbi:Serine/Threonine kinase domain protein (macronuclear) [Tetrahymena thermophila SB210]|uniref:Serine/Threonine kinase domain protein n=1 Tax=Tetrahymena thermophila (strain SB210) TaxID=312017 RepID=I7LZM4_TETTS|nr:Serine/Threonine kinase domain protein [Tetrahymena thermophila SB210]EAR84278.2 Serine/Threonine kinase domain protein [Tetrahymena thermophila SB210]|eukprot:XP_001031941.2 Serine/Threonine kinase domain protein [Tetrahymena thermophila SB210]
MQKENELIVGDISESSRNNSSNPSQEEIQLSYIQQNRRMFQRSGAINIQTPSRNSNSGVAVRQSRFCKTQVYSSEQSQEQLLQILNAKKSQREKILEQNTPLSSKNGRRGSLNIYSKLEALGQKNQTLTKLKTQSDLDSNDEEENFEEKVSKYTLYEIAKQSSIQELDEDTFQKNQHSVFAVPSHQQFIQDQNLEVPEEDSSDEDANDQEQQLNNSKVNNLPPPSQLKSNYHQRVKSMMSGTQEKTKYSPQRNSLQDALQNIIQKHEARPMKSRNLSQVSPLQKQIFQQKIMSINNFNMPSLSPECSPINGYDDLVDDHNETQFSLQSMQRTELEIAELDQLNQIKENIQLKQKMSHQHECQMDRRNAHENENLNKSHEIIGERRGNQKRTTFRSLSNRRIVKESTLIHKSKINGQKTMNQYEIGSVLGEGQYGKVRYAKVKDENGSFQEFAIKYFKKQQLKKMKQFYKDEKGRTKIFTGIQTVQSEIAVMKKLEHENIVKLYEVIDDTENDKIYLEIEYFAQSQTEYKNSDLVKEKVFFIEEYLLRKIFRDCLKGLGYLHFNDVIHRDLKPQNILFTQNGTAVITDFSISLILGEQKVLKQDQGTLCFMAPELIDNEKNVEKNNDFYKRADIWSLGVTFFCFVFYTTPYKSTNLEDLFNEISTTDLQFPKTRSISFGLKLILKSMLNSHPLERITLDELIDDEWVNDGYSSLLRDEIELQEKVVISQQDIKQAMVPKNEVAFINGSINSINSSSMISYSAIDSCKSLQYDTVTYHE